MSDVLTTKCTFYNEIPLPDDLKKMLSKKEIPLFSVKTLRDATVFTNKRILIADKKGITVKKLNTVLYLTNQLLHMLLKQLVLLI